MKTARKLSKYIVAGVVFLFCVGAKAQIDMYVASGTSVFVNNNVLTVTKGLELNASDSMLYLRNGAQLVQKHTEASQNTGLGRVSVYQEGIANQYMFNYWCSPVGSPSVDDKGITPTTSNGKFGIKMLGQPITSTATTPAAIIGGYDGIANPLQIPSYWIYTYVSSGAYADWKHAYSDTSIEPGLGFTMKGTLGTDITNPGELTANNPGNRQRYDFRGKPNDGDIDIPVEANELTLIGNPYPSAIDLNLFLTAEGSHNDGNAYYWEQDPKNSNSHNITDYVGGYGVYCGETGLYNPAAYETYDISGNPITPPPPPPLESDDPIENSGKRFAPVGQGFMINGNTTGTDTMRNEYRVYVQEGVANNSVFSKGKNLRVAETATPYIRFNTVLGGLVTRQIVQAFGDRFTEGVDRGGDALDMNDYPSKVSFLVEDKVCVMSAVPFDINRKLPLILENANTEQASYKIYVKEIVNLDQVSEVYLHDKTTDMYYDIKNDFYELNLPEGVNDTQYEITFQNGSALGVDNVNSDSFIIYQNNSIKKLIVKNPKLKDITAYYLYDINGKFISKKKISEVHDSYEFSTEGLSQGIYIAKVTAKGDEVQNQKVIIE